MFWVTKENINECPVCQGSGYMPVVKVVKRGVLFVKIVAQDYCPLCYCSGRVTVLSNHEHERRNRKKGNIYSRGSAFIQKLKRDWIHFFEEGDAR